MTDRADIVDADGDSYNWKAITAGCMCSRCRSGRAKAKAADAKAKPDRGERCGGIGCFDWPGSISPNGYGRLPDNSYVHRVVYEACFGTIKEGLHVDHLCRNRRCFNPLHLEAVSVRENILRGVGATAINARKSHCLRGHEFTDENTYMRHDPRSDQMQRQCRECHKLRQRIRKSALLKSGEFAPTGNTVIDSRDEYEKGPKR